MLDTLDIVFLGTIGLGTVAWFARKQLFSRFGGASGSKSTTAANAKAAPPVKRKERNFVKVMKDQVCAIPKDNAHLLRMGIGLGTAHPVGHHHGHL
jgi:hypothetical protein